jgi:CRISPR/Cas system-associated protein endoribonuclease Cas2
MTDPYEYGVPPSVVVIFYNLATNNTALAFVLLLCAWAELLNENNIKVSSSGWLNDYKKHFFMACLLRLATQSVFGCLSAGNPNDSYRIIHRIWLIDWAWILFAIGIATFVLVSRLIRELRSRAAKQEVVDKARERPEQIAIKLLPITYLQMTRLRLLVGLITAVAGVACVVHAIILEIVDRYPWLSMICISVYHGATKTGIIWIIIVKPQNVRSGKTTKPGNSTNATQTVNSLQESSGDR